MAQVSADYNALFIGVNVLCRHIVAHGLRARRKRKARFSFRTGDAISGYASRSHRTLLLAASWLEDQSTEDESEDWKHCSVSICYPGVVRSLAKGGPCNYAFLAHHGTANPRCYSAMWDELEEDSEE